jgi:hypothetical protein
MSTRYRKISDAVKESILNGSAVYITPQGEQITFVNGKRLEIEIVSNDKPPYTLKIYTNE